MGRQALFAGRHNRYWTGGDKVKKEYQKPGVESEPVFETLAASCTWVSVNDEACNPDMGGTVSTMPSG